MGGVRGIASELLLLALLTSVFVFGYAMESSSWGVQGGISSGLWSFEIPFSVLLTWSLYAPGSSRLGSRVMRLCVPLGCLFVLYVGCDVAYAIWSRSALLSDLALVVHLRENEPGVFAGIVVALCALSGGLLWTHLRWLFEAGGRDAWLGLALKGGAVLLLWLAFVSPRTLDYQLAAMDFVHWGDRRNIKANGRLATVVFHHGRNSRAFERVSAPSKLRPDDYLWLGEIGEPRSLHLIVLESFIDPRPFLPETVPSPLHSSLLAYMGTNGFSVVRSPVYGGLTAQAEFELLTGVPALFRLGTAEFNLLGNRPLTSLVRRLREQGYHTIASAATAPGYYNSQVAYQSLGFAELHFRDDDLAHQGASFDKFLFDGDLLDANLTRIEEHAPGKPILSYVLGMYGHRPYLRNLTLRPDVIEVPERDGDAADLHAISNQFYYRTAALGAYLDALRTRDPHSVVLVISDHLPPFAARLLPDGPDRKRNIALLLDAFEPVDVSGLHYYEIAHVLWGLLSNGRATPTVRAEDLPLEELYFALLREGMIGQAP